MKNSELHSGIWKLIRMELSSTDNIMSADNTMFIIIQLIVQRTSHRTLGFVDQTHRGPSILEWATSVAPNGWSLLSVSP